MRTRFSPLCPPRPRPSTRSTPWKWSAAAAAAVRKFCADPHPLRACRRRPWSSRRRPRRRWRAAFRRCTRSCGGNCAYAPAWRRNSRGTWTSAQPCTRACRATISSSGGSRASTSRCSSSSSRCATRASAATICSPSAAGTARTSSAFDACREGGARAWPGSRRRMGTACNRFLSSRGSSVQPTRAPASAVGFRRQSITPFVAPPHLPRTPPGYLGKGEDGGAGRPRQRGRLPRPRGHSSLSAAPGEAGGLAADLAGVGCPPPSPGYPPCLPCDCASSVQPTAAPGGPAGRRHYSAVITASGPPSDSTGRAADIIIHMLLTACHQ
mmetsp:Transcript_878/g.2485  ORF Transcript_878/g.2485 Transcript_878/m.2485 type:complete len:325 (-) Transcript_878:96-1070(-)